MKFQSTILSLLCILFFSCKSDKETEDINNGANLEETTEQVQPNYYSNGELTVITEAMDFQTADTINSGWNRILYTNNSPEVHFILLDKLPSDSINASDITDHLMPPFDQGMLHLMNNKPDSAMAEFGKIPAWFNDVRRYGGTGLISPEKVAESFVNLEPGHYMMECYVKMANGEFHTSHGMWKFITVTDSSTDLSPPTSQTTVSLSSQNGYTVEGQPQTGFQTFKVDFTDQVPYEHFSGHDVNLVKYDDTANIDSLVAWLDWRRPTGLRTPSPQGFTFMGGMNNCKTGHSGSFVAELDAGNYLLISETPEADDKGLMKKFTVISN